MCIFYLITEKFKFSWLLEESCQHVVPALFLIQEVTRLNMFIVFSYVVLYLFLFHICERVF